MSAVFVDTSGLFALADSNDQRHADAARTFALLRTRRTPLVTTSYVLVETCALLGRRLGMEAVASFRADFSPLLDIVWVDQSIHESGLDLLAARKKRRLSLVDAVSFVTMRRRKITEAFAFDPDFEQEGFSAVD